MLQLLQSLVVFGLRLRYMLTTAWFTVKYISVLSVCLWCAETTDSVVLVVVVPGPGLASTEAGPLDTTSGEDDQWRQEDRSQASQV